jgi:hypothetical protein
MQSQPRRMLSRGAVALVHTPVNTTSAKGCVGGVAGDVTSPAGHITSDPVDVKSATADVKSHNSYIGHSYRCNIGSNLLPSDTIVLAVSASRPMIG